MDLLRFIEPQRSFPLIEIVSFLPPVWLIYTDENNHISLLEAFYAFYRRQQS